MRFWIYLVKNDLHVGYHQIWFQLRIFRKQLFGTIDGYFQFFAMLFGLPNSTSAFQTAMNEFTGYPISFYWCLTRLG